MGLRSCAWLSLVAANRGHSPLRCACFSCYGGFSRCGARAPDVWASVDVARRLQSTGPAAVAHGLSRSGACGILPDQGTNPRPLHWQADSQPLCHQGSPDVAVLSLNPQDNSQETQAGFLCFSLEKSSFHFGEPQSLLLRPSTDWMRLMDIMEGNQLYSKLLI